jgi:hypothetical protein
MLCHQFVTNSPHLFQLRCTPICLQILVWGQLILQAHKKFQNWLPLIIKRIYTFQSEHLRVIMGYFITKSSTLLLWVRRGSGDPWLVNASYVRKQDKKSTLLDSIASRVENLWLIVVQIVIMIRIASACMFQEFKNAACAGKCEVVVVGVGKVFFKGAVCNSMN